MQGGGGGGAAAGGGEGEGGAQQGARHLGVAMAEYAEGGVATSEHKRGRGNFGEMGLAGFFTFVRFQLLLIGFEHFLILRYFTCSFFFINRCY